jgi:hypothetical protein
MLMTYVESILKVLVVGLVLGAGLPAVFAVGLVSYSSGAGGVEADGTVHAQNPVLKYLGLLLFAFVAVVIVAALLWIARPIILHHFGINLFPFIK